VSSRHRPGLTEPLHRKRKETDHGSHQLLISLVSGAVGANIAGAAMQDKNLGVLGNSIAGIVGGGLGGALLRALGVLGQSGGGLDLGSIIGNVASGGVGGAVLLIIVSLIKSAMAKA
jgi:uncharacterized membrane protein YeaQ/YmgE (transglycosylase-associated protein family)